MERPTPAETQHFRSLIGEVVIQSATIEAKAKSLLSGLAGEGLKHPDHFRVDVLIADLDHFNTLERLKTILAEFESGKLREHMEHSIKVMDRYRVQRNYYIHGISRIDRTQDGKIVGVVESASSRKGKFIESLDYVTTDDLYTLARGIYDTNVYLSLLILIRFSLPKAMLANMVMTLDGLKPELPAEFLKSSQSVVGSFLADQEQMKAKQEAERLIEELGHAADVETNREA